jgi:hypothetical protein
VGVICGNVSGGLEVIDLEESWVLAEFKVKQAQDLSLIDRPASSKADAANILHEWLRQTTRQ